MNTFQFETDPWPHMFSDQVYTEQQLRAATKEIVTAVKQNKFSFYNKHVAEYNLGSFPEAHKIFNVLNEDKLRELLTRFSNTRPHEKLKLERWINIIVGENHYPIHCDRANKILTVVTYLFPKESIGTILYDTEKNYVKTLDWRVGRTFVFAPLDDHTWHSFKTNEHQVRITLNQSLISV